MKNDTRPVAYCKLGERRVIEILSIEGEYVVVAFNFGLKRYPHKLKLYETAHGQKFFKISQVRYYLDEFTRNK